MNSPASSHLGLHPEALLVREGFRLLASRRIVLPVWRVNINSRLLKKKKVPTIDEFVLRSVGLGLTEASEIRDLLNLPREVVEGVLSALIADRHILLARSDVGQSQFTLSPSGLRLVETLIVEKPVERIVAFSVNGISGEPMVIARNRLMSANDLDDQPHLLVDVADEVELEFGPADTDRFVNALPVNKGGESEALLSLLGTESTTKMYLAGVGLLFQSKDHAEDLYLRVCIDGRSQDDLEEILRTSGVLTEMRLESRIAEDRMRVDRALGARILAERSPDAVVEDLKIEIARRGISVAEEPSQGATSGSTRALSKLSALPVIRLDIAEAKESLQLAMSSARAEVLISTSRLWPIESVDEYVKLILQLLNAEVAVNLEVPADQRQMAKVDISRLNELESTCAGTALMVWPTKAAHEANFVAIDGTVVHVFANSPFHEMGFSSERLGDDRPTAVEGFEHVQDVLSTLHERSAAMSAPPRKREAKPLRTVRR